MAYMPLLKELWLKEHELKEDTDTIIMFNLHLPGHPIKSSHRHQIEVHFHMENCNNPYKGIIMHALVLIIIKWRRYQICKEKEEVKFIILLLSIPNIHSHLFNSLVRHVQRTSSSAMELAIKLYYIFITLSGIFFNVYV